MPEPYRSDNWSWSNRWIGDGITEPRSTSGWQLAPTWVPSEDQRRLACYTICAAMLDLCSHYWQPHLSDLARSQWREYGDFQLFAMQARSSLLGETQTVTVDVPEADEQDTAGETLAEQARDWLQEWADQESLTSRLLDAEYDAVGLGDAVYVLALDKTRPRVRVYDPGFYFPDPTSQGIDDDYPRTVHLAWEEPHPTKPDTTLLRRRTWKLVKLAGLYAPEVQPPARTYPWSAEAATETVLYWDGTWDLSAVSGTTGLYDLSDNAASWSQLDDGRIARAVDLEIDFIPVVHIPNGSPGKVTWGRPVYWSTSRLLDDIAASDTDAQVGSELYGSGALLDTGGGLPDTTGPGSKWVGDGKFLDMSAGMKAMVEFRQSQRELASVNARLPAEVLGRVKASEVPSGLALRLAFGPLSSLVRELRRIRADKYPLLLKFTMRLAQKAGLLPEGVLPRAELVFGSYLPSDRAEALEMATTGLTGTSPVFSLQTAVQILVDAGFPIEDAVDEVRRIRREGFAQAGLLLDAAGDEQAVRTLLNTGEMPELADSPAALPVPVPNLPTGGGA